MNLATWKMWRVDAAKGFWLGVDAFALSPDFLYFTENDDVTYDYKVTRRVVRLDLAKLDVLGKALP